MLGKRTALPAPWLNDIFKICGFIRMCAVSSYVKEDTSVSWPTWCQGCLQVTAWDQWSVPFSYVNLGRHTVMTLLDLAFSLHFEVYNHLMLHFLWAESTQEAKSLEESSFLHTRRAGVDIAETLSSLEWDWSSRCGLVAQTYMSFLFCQEESLLLFAFIFNFSKVRQACIYIMVLDKESLV